MWCMETPGKDMSLLSLVPFLWRLPVERYFSYSSLVGRRNRRQSAGQSYRMSQVGTVPRGRLSQTNQSVLLFLIVCCGNVT